MFYAAKKFSIATLHYNRRSSNVYMWLKRLDMHPHCRQGIYMMSENIHYTLDYKAMFLITTEVRKTIWV